MKWLLGVVVVVILGILVWWSGIFPGSTSAPASQQSAAAVNAVATTTATTTGGIGTNGTAGGNASVSGVAVLTVQMDQEIQANASAFASMGSTPSQAAEAGVIARIGSIDAQMLKASDLLQAMIVTAKGAGKSVVTSQTALADMQSNVSGATTLLVAAQKALATVNPSKGSANATVLSGVLVQLKSAQGNVQAARADIQVIVTASTH